MRSDTARTEFDAVVGDAQAIELHQHVADLELAPGAGAVLHRRHQHPAVPRLHAEVRAQRRVLERLRRDAEAGHARVLALLHAVEEAADDRCRHHLADVLGLLQRLERDADHLAAREHRSAAVALVDRGVDRRRQQMALAVFVALHLDARHHALGDRHLLATDRIAHHLHRVAQVRQVADHRRPDAARERLVVDVQQREVAVVADRQHARGDLGRFALLLHLHERRVRHHVRTGQHQVRADDDPRAGAAARGDVLPRTLVVGVLVGAVDADDLRVRHGNDRSGRQPGRRR